MAARKILMGGIAVGVVLLLSGVAFFQPLFAPPVNLGPKINTSAFESDPFWDGPRKRLYFLSSRDGGSRKIYFSDWTDTGWTDPVKLGPQINTGGEFSPSVTPDGQKLYFVADARQGFLWDIWVSTWDSSVNDWGTPVNVGYPVNTPDVEFSAHLVPDGRLFFSSCCYADSQFPFGRCGIFASEWNGSSWSAPQYQWGCSTQDYPTVPADGQWLYFHDFVSDGKSIFAVAWEDSNWVIPAYDLRQQLGGRAVTPSITPSGDSLFFSGTFDLGGFGGNDIWVAKRLLRGDLNMDNLLTAADVVLELNKVFLDEPYPAPESLGDMNCDSKFTPADAVLLLQVVYLEIPPEC